MPDPCTVWPTGNDIAPNEGFEGRCLPSCIPATQMYARYKYNADGIGGDDDFLKLDPQPGDPVDNQNTCGSGLICTPCYNPATGDDLGTCRIGSVDAPTTTASANMYDECCDLDDGNGTQVGACVPDVFPYPETLSKAPDEPENYCDSDHVCITKVAAVGGSLPHCNTDYIGDDWPQLIDPTPDDHDPAYCHSFWGFTAQAIGGGGCAPACGLESNGGPTPQWITPNSGDPGYNDCPANYYCVPCGLNQNAVTCGSGTSNACITGACAGPTFPHMDDDTGQFPVPAGRGCWSP
ncbi:MAG: hypothetical protein GY832_38235 [Chloroflexi bacterium]|nr:hypothetical protein [Chloroflexota bacterium]